MAARLPSDMNAIRFAAFCLLLLGLAGTARSQGAAAAGAAGGAVSVTFDGNKFADQIKSLVNDLVARYNDRSSVVRNLCDKVHYDNPGWNVLVCNRDQGDKCSPSVTGGPNNKNPAFTTAAITGNGKNNLPFGVWLFKSGTLDHCGADGGYINWCFWGGTRSGKDGCKVTW